MEKKWDYIINFSSDEFNILPFTIQNIIADDYDACEIDDSIDNPDVTLIIEFDGQYHYTKNSQASFERPGGKWVKLDENVFLLRIPYWVQLDSQLSKLWFDIDKDFSDDFPHGFISKTVYLPENFCRRGEERFIKEMKILPKNVSLKVFQSLLDKTGYPDKLTPKKMAQVGSLEVWQDLVENYHSEWSDLLKIMNVCSPDVDKFYKRFTPELYYKIETNPIVKSIYFYKYYGFLDKDELQQSLLEYCKWHGLKTSIFNTMK